MPRRTRGLILLAGGTLLVLVSLGADVLGLGGFPGFGWKQIVGSFVGVVVAVAGALGLRS